MCICLQGRDVYREIDKGGKYYATTGVLYYDDSYHIIFVRTYLKVRSWFYSPFLAVLASSSSANFALAALLAFNRKSVLDTLSFLNAYALLSPFGSAANPAAAVGWVMGSNGVCS